MAQDKGHENLLKDIIDLLEDIKKYEYHDFKSSLGAPKVELVARLEALKLRAKYGAYDNLWENDNEN